MRIAFIGGGHMTTSLIGGLRASGMPGDALWVADPVPAQLKRLRRDFDVHTTPDNSAALREGDVVVLAVKPQDVGAVARGISPELARGRHSVISIAAGIRLADLARWLGADAPVVRAMPNRPALRESAHLDASRGRRPIGHRSLVGRRVSWPVLGIVPCRGAHTCKCAVRQASWQHGNPKDQAVASLRIPVLGPRPAGPRG